MPHPPGVEVDTAAVSFGGVGTAAGFDTGSFAGVGGGVGTDAAAGVGAGAGVDTGSGSGFGAGAGFGFGFGSGVGFGAASGSLGIRIGEAVAVGVFFCGAGRGFISFVRGVPCSVAEV